MRVPVRCGVSPLPSSDKTTSTRLGSVPIKKVVFGFASVCVANRAVRQAKLVKIGPVGFQLQSSMTIVKPRFIDPNHLVDLRANASRHVATAGECLQGAATQ